jgi:hypothetical protein
MGNFPPHYFLPILAQSLPAICLAGLCAFILADLRAFILAGRFWVIFALAHKTCGFYELRFYAGI